MIVFQKKKNTTRVAACRYSCLHIADISFPNSISFISCYVMSSIICITLRCIVQINLQASESLLTYSAMTQWKKNKLKSIINKSLDKYKDMARCMSINNM